MVLGESDVQRVEMWRVAMVRLTDIRISVKITLSFQFPVALILGLAG
jgi:hypothetical protein